MAVMRLSISKAGINVTAVDNLADYINEIKEIAGKENLPVTALTARRNAISVRR